MKYWLQFSLLFLFLTIDVFSQDNFWSKTSLDSIRILAFSHSNNNILYAGSNGKLYKSIDGGLNWENIINNWSNTYIDNIVACNDSIVLLGTSASGTSNYVGVLRSADQGMTWLKVALADTSIWTLYESKNEITYAGTGNGDIYRSTDTGLHWLKVYTNTNGNGIHSIASDNNTKLICGFYQGSIARSTDDGLNWSSYSPSWTVQYIYDLLFIDDFILAATNSGIFKSTDIGETWNQLDPTIIKSAVKLILTPPSQIYALDGNWLNGKLYFSNDKGVTWNVLNSGLPDNSYFYDMSKHGNYIFVGTDYGIYKSKEIITSVQDKNENLPSNYSLFQNYPNPFNPTTTISYSIPKTSFVTIKVYDVLGKEIFTLVNAEKTVGSYRIEFNASELASGIYFYRMQTGDFVETKKLFLLK